MPRFVVDSAHNLIASIAFQGSVRQLQELKGWRGHSVLYFGDHPYSDLADVTLKHSWRTGAIISELAVSERSCPLVRCINNIYIPYISLLQHEIQTLNRVDFKMSANWLQMLTQLIEETQDDDSEAAQISLRRWMDERDQLRYSRERERC